MIMIRRYAIFLMSAALLLITGSCQEEVLLEGSGVSDASWTGTLEADEEGEMFSLTFNASASWTATSSAPEWCQLLTENGVEGAAALRINVAGNTSIEGRRATITITVNGYPQQEEFTISQKEGVTEKGDGRYREINEWVYQKMSETYLWNEHIADLALDYSIGYQEFLESILDGISKYDDVNHDDGAYNNEYRTEYYTKIVSNAPDTRAVGEQTYGNGFYSVKPVNLGTAIGAAVMTVTPGGPADRQGIKRGDFITAVNGVAITMDNYKSVINKIYTDPISVLINTVRWEGANLDKAVVTPTGTVNLQPEYYTDPAIYKAMTIDTDNGKKIGYLLYMGFHTDFDNELIEVFEKFKTDGIDDLVLDLRHNNGGEIISSTVMATLIAGSQHQGKTLANLVFNKARTETGERATYQIGVPQTKEYPEGYPLIRKALDHSLDLNRVFVITSGYTASASEIIINGLRGLDIEVNLIGTRTSGKNVGMEGFSKRFRNYDFILYPVSFYIENAKGFSDYPDGFGPDLYYDDSPYYPGGDYGTMDDFLCNAAFGWIKTGKKPSQISKSMSVISMETY